MTEVIAVAVVGALGAGELVLWDAQPWSRAEESAAMGWTAFRLGLLSVAVTLSSVAGVFTLMASLMGVRAAVVGGLAATVWLPRLCMRLFRLAVAASFRPARDRALLSWLRRVRLYVGAGQPIAAAVLAAAERVPDRAFGPIRTAVSRALAHSRDPLSAVSERLAGSAVEPLVSTLAAAERSGSASITLLDQVLDRAVRVLSSRKIERIERMARSVSLVSTIVTLIATGLVMMAVVFTVIL